MRSLGCLRSKRFAPTTAILAASLALVLGSASCSRTVEPITVAWSPFEHSALFYVAEDQGFFSQNGLAVTSRMYAVPAAAIDGMLDGEVDVVVGAAEWPLVRRAFERQRLRAFGNIDEAGIVFLVGRKDRGIAQVSDLQGKRVGTTPGTVSEFYLGRFLELHGMAMQDVTVVEVKTPAEWVDAVVTGEIDAVVTGQPHVSAIVERLGANAVGWPAQSNQSLYALLIATDEWITAQPDRVVRFLRSLAQAEDYLVHNPDDAKAIVQARLNLDAEYMETVWSQNQFSLSLDQSLVFAMEDEARWMMQNHLTSETAMPNFLDYIYEDGLAAIQPEAVNIIR